MPHDAGIEAIRKVLDTARFQTRALCLRHQQAQGLQQGCRIERGLDLETFFEQIAL